MTFIPYVTLVKINAQRSIASILNFMHRSLLKAAVIFVPLLGSTWVFGVLAVNENTVVFAWIFTVLNSLQVSLV